MKTTSKSLITLGLMAAFLMTSTGIQASSSDCCDNNGSKICGAGTANFLTLCGYNDDTGFDWQICTGSSPGTPIWAARWGRPSGGSRYLPDIALCSVTMTATGTCCGGAVTSWWAASSTTRDECISIWPFNCP